MLSTLNPTWPSVRTTRDCTGPEPYIPLVKMEVCLPQIQGVLTTAPLGGVPWLSLQHCSHLVFLPFRGRLAPTRPHLLLEPSCGCGGCLSCSPRNTKKAPRPRCCGVTTWEMAQFSAPVLFPWAMFTENIVGVNMCVPSDPVSQFSMGRVKFLD